MEMSTVQNRRVDLAQLLVGVQRAHPVVNLAAILTDSRRVGERRVQAVEVPGLRAEVTRDDGLLTT
jgi:hypothetical protein